MDRSYINYFLTHIVLADNQIDDKEMLFLQDFLDKQENVSEEEQMQIEKILSNAEDKITLEQTILAFQEEGNTENQELALEMGLTIALCTHFFDEEEANVLDTARQAWGISNQKYEQLKQEVQTFIKESVRDNSETKKSAFYAKLANSNFIKLVEVAQKWFPKSMQKLFEDLNEKILLRGPEYGRAIEFSKKIAEEDLNYAKPILERHKSLLSELPPIADQMLREIDDGKEDELDIKQAITDLKDQVNKIVDVRLSEVTDSLYKKKRAMNYFTVSFIGKTKAGKSTLHAVVTGKGSDAIGKGKQRTTRYNRVYTWNNIRIIDTPGIGAPGGKSDEEIAESIIDESDVICYVVKNDSVQPAEFKFLKSIKDKNKPIITLLNVKENLDHPVRLKRFLENPEYMYERKDSKSLDGHITRIKRYAEEHYQNDLFDIIPVQLYAALLSKDDKFNTSEKEKLYRGSHMENFLNSLRLSIIEDGHIRRSQTMLDGSLYPVTETKNVIHGHVEVFQLMREKLAVAKDKGALKLDEIYSDYKKRLSQSIDKEFSKVEDKISPFSTDNYKCSKSELESKWKKTIKSIGLEKSLKSALTEEFNAYASEIEKYLKEMVEDLSYAGQQLSQEIRVDLPNMFDTKRMFGYFAAAGSIATAVSLFLPAAIAGPLGWIGIGVAVTGTVLSFFVKSKKKKIKEAIDMLTNSLEDSVQEQKQEVKKNVLEKFHDSHEELKTTIDTYQYKLITGLDHILKELVSSEKEIRNQINDLNQAFAYRLLHSDTKREQYPFELNNESIDQLVHKVERDFGKGIKIQTSKELTEEQQKQLTIKLQEKITVETVPAEESLYVESK